MSIVSRYLHIQFAKYFSLILLAVLGLYTMIDFIEKIDDFIEAQLPLSLALKYLLLNMPFVISQITPLTTLLVVLITFGLMNKHNELIALRAGGISLVTMLAPVLWFSTGAFILVLLMSEIVSPLTVTHANIIWNQKVRHRETAVTRHNDIWLKGEQSIIHLAFYDTATKTARRVTVHRFDGDFQLTERMDAETAIFQNTHWLMRQGLTLRHDSRNGHFIPEIFDERTIELDITPDDLARAVPQTAEMNFFQLRDYIQKVEDAGYDAGRYKVDLQAKIAFPFVCILMALVGAGLSGGGKLREGLPLSISCGIGIAFVYWIAFSFCVSLGYADKLPSFIAAWTVNLIWLCLAVFLLISAEQ
jgi:lipopolysaccharide export system permease protein